MYKIPAVMKDITELLAGAKQASRSLLTLTDREIDSTLRDIADALLEESDSILSANARDMEWMGAANPMRDRLALSKSRLEGIAADLRHVAELESPLHRTLEARTLPNGLKLEKVAVPFGVIGVIYEARPNVTVDVTGLCLKSGNAVVLKGGHDAECSNRAIVEVIHAVLSRHGIAPGVVTLLPSDREATAQLLAARGMVDLLIPRGSKKLIDYVRGNALIPVIETGAGVCHAYFHTDGDVNKGEKIVTNAKTRRVSVCNALDTLIVDRSRLADLPALCAGVMNKNVAVYADPEAYTVLKGQYPDRLLNEADADSFGREFLDYKMSVKTVGNLDEALEHIARYGSGHSDSIVTEDSEAADRFLTLVDSACVYHNAPTSFTDGAQFGLGAEIGISTQKLHARGPMALRELTTYKWLIEGEGQVRE